MFQGRTEFMEKFGPVFAHLNKLGYNAASLDWRGQGLSDRLHRNPRLGHVENFNDYQMDIDCFLEFLREQGIKSYSYLLAHSMGGAIGMDALNNGLRVEKAIFSAPMWDIAVQGWKREFLAFYVRYLGGAMFLHSKIPTTPYRNSSITDPFEGNTLTNSRKEYAHRREQIVKYPDLELAGPTVNWVVQSFKSTARIRRRPPPDIPMLCIMGEAETIVSPETIADLDQKWPNMKIVYLADAQHELFLETPKVTKKLWAAIEDFIKT